MKHTLTVIAFLVSFFYSQAQIKSRKDTSNLDFHFATSSHGITIQSARVYWIEFSKRTPHIAMDDFSDCWVIAHNSSSAEMWKWHFSSDTLYIDTTKVKHIIYLK